MNKFGKKLSENKIAFGTFCALKDPAIIEILGYAGYDFAIIDLEHSTLDLSTVEHFIRAAKVANVTSIVRMTQGDFPTILRVVEAGAEGIMFPHVMSKEDAQKIVDMAKYPPVGRRGIDGSTRSAKYGNVSMTEHMRLQNENVSVIGMIEDKEAVENLDVILQVEGLDYLFIGAADLSTSYNLPHQVTHPTVQKAIKEIISKANAAGIKVGVPAYDEVQTGQVIEMGAGFVTSPAVDTYHLTETLTKHLNKVKNYQTER
ncbi:aldolase/citrate lyase family protein [Aeromicrobium ponti]|uniref:4-hydroxy-2-oxoheptanedioate aldolase n=1 Tax=Cytobacillus oceanisediminis TaxID=665099 RepID=A0A562JRI3_9BACI|nr:aldolase/citrate lyase family protein [Cytobacillus oceanisediminis]TWH85779.1 4-hydroxy-2-oxoheptanedioate aldolase [Cytobacillus oceanisediminis]